VVIFLLAALPLSSPTPCSSSGRALTSSPGYPKRQCRRWQPAPRPVPSPPGSLPRIVLLGCPGERERTRLTCLLAARVSRSGAARLGHGVKARKGSPISPDSLLLPCPLLGSEPPSCAPHQRQRQQRRDAGQEPHIPPSQIPSGDVARLAKVGASLGESRGTELSRAGASCWLSWH